MAFDKLPFSAKATPYNYRIVIKELEKRYSDNYIELSITLSDCPLTNHAAGSMIQWYDKSIMFL